MSPFVLGALVVVGMPLLFWSSIDHRLAFDAEGELVVLKTWWWGAGGRVEGRLDGVRGRWWFTGPDDKTEVWVPPKFLVTTKKVVPKVVPKP